MHSGNRSRQPSPPPQQQGVRRAAAATRPAAAAAVGIDPDTANALLRISRLIDAAESDLRRAEDERRTVKEAWLARDAALRVSQDHHANEHGGGESPSAVSAAAQRPRSDAPSPAEFSASRPESSVAETYRSEGPVTAATSPAAPLRSTGALDGLGSATVVESGPVPPSPVADEASQRREAAAAAAAAAEEEGEHSGSAAAAAAAAASASITAAALEVARDGPLDFFDTAFDQRPRPVGRRTSAPQNNVTVDPRSARLRAPEITIAAAEVNNAASITAGGDGSSPSSPAKSAAGMISSLANVSASSFAAAAAGTPQRAAGSPPPTLGSIAFAVAAGLADCRETAEVALHQSEHARRHVADAMAVSLVYSGRQRRLTEIEQRRKRREEAAGDDEVDIIGLLESASRAQSFRRVRSDREAGLGAEGGGGGGGGGRLRPSVSMVLRAVDEDNERSLGLPAESNHARGNGSATAAANDVIVGEAAATLRAIQLEKTVAELQTTVTRMLHQLHQCDSGVRELHHEVVARDDAIAAVQAKVDTAKESAVAATIERDTLRREVWTMRAASKLRVVLNRRLRKAAEAANRQVLRLKRELAETVAKANEALASARAGLHTGGESFELAIKPDSRTSSSQKAAAAAAARASAHVQGVHPERCVVHVAIDDFIRLHERAPGTIARAVALFRCCVEQTLIEACATATEIAGGGLLHPEVGSPHASPTRSEPGSPTGGAGPALQCYTGLESPLDEMHGVILAASDDGGVPGSGDGAYYMIGFSNTTDALRFATNLQLVLHCAAWPAAFATLATGAAGTTGVLPVVTVKDLPSNRGASALNTDGTPTSLTTISRQVEHYVRHQRSEQEAAAAKAAATKGAASNRSGAASTRPTGQPPLAPEACAALARAASEAARLVIAQEAAARSSSLSIEGQQQTTGGGRGRGRDGSGHAVPPAEVLLRGLRARIGVHVGPLPMETCRVPPLEARLLRVRDPASSAPKFDTFQMCRTAAESAAGSSKAANKKRRSTETSAASSPARAGRTASATPTGGEVPPAMAHAAPQTLYTATGVAVTGERSVEVVVAYGDTAMKASALCRTAMGGEILMSEAARSQSRSWLANHAFSTTLPLSPEPHTYHQALQRQSAHTLALLFDAEEVAYQVLPPALAQRAVYFAMVNAATSSMEDEATTTPARVAPDAALRRLSTAPYNPHWWLRFSNNAPPLVGDVSQLLALGNAVYQAGRDHEHNATLTGLGDTASTLNATTVFGGTTTTLKAHDVDLGATATSIASGVFGPTGGGTPTPGAPSLTPVNFNATGGFGGPSSPSVAEALFAAPELAAARLGISVADAHALLGADVVSLKKAHARARAELRAMAQRAVAAERISESRERLAMEAEDEAPWATAVGVLATARLESVHSLQTWAKESPECARIAASSSVVAALKDDLSNEEWSAVTDAHTSIAAGPAGSRALHPIAPLAATAGALRPPLGGAASSSQANFGASSRRTTGAAVAGLQVGVRASDAAITAAVSAVFWVMRRDYVRLLTLWNWDDHADAAAESRRIDSATAKVAGTAAQEGSARAPQPPSSLSGPSGAASSNRRGRARHSSFVARDGPAASSSRRAESPSGDDAATGGQTQPRLSRSRSRTVVTKGVQKALRDYDRTAATTAAFEPAVQGREGAVSVLQKLDAKYGTPALFVPRLVAIFVLSVRHGADPTAFAPGIPLGRATRASWNAFVECYVRRLAVQRPNPAEGYAVSDAHIASLDAPWLTPSFAAVASARLAADHAAASIDDLVHSLCLPAGASLSLLAPESPIELLAQVETHRGQFARALAAVRSPASGILRQTAAFTELRKMVAAASASSAAEHGGASPRHADDGLLAALEANTIATASVSELSREVHAPPVDCVSFAGQIRLRGHQLSVFVRRTLVIDTLILGGCRDANGEATQVALRGLMRRHDASRRLVACAMRELPALQTLLLPATAFAYDTGDAQTSFTTAGMSHTAVAVVSHVGASGLKGRIPVPPQQLLRGGGTGTVGGGGDDSAPMRHSPYWLSLGMWLARVRSEFAAAFTDPQDDRPEAECDPDAVHAYNDVVLIVTWRVAVALEALHATGMPHGAVDMDSVLVPYTPVLASAAASSNSPFAAEAAVPEGVRQHPEVFVAHRCSEAWEATLCFGGVGPMTVPPHPQCRAPELIAGIIDHALLSRAGAALPAAAEAPADMWALGAMLFMAATIAPALAPATATPAVAAAMDRSAASAPPLDASARTVVPPLMPSRSPAATAVTPAAGTGSAADSSLQLPLATLGYTFATPFLETADDDDEAFGAINVPGNAAGDGGHAAAVDTAGVAQLQTVADAERRGCRAATLRGRLAANRSNNGHTHLPGMRRADSSLGKAARLPVAPWIEDAVVRCLTFDPARRITAARLVGLLTEARLDARATARGGGRAPTRAGSDSLQPPLSRATSVIAQPAGGNASFALNTSGDNVAGTISPRNDASKPLAASFGGLPQYRAPSPATNVTLGRS